ncbi:beta-ketoacyl synthase chain length factor [Actinoplanes sp. N902-109]|uniref:beta-ketoacyl synthase chain length factor n=1 Tax=Actinoplanes sp. (strain N902-109) TaxID=649831 RepID=UPI000329427A|nr:beta-ketoacyl synthase chain length factor [Actinoplanes sp. N902-109]AGL16384.1 AsuC14 [Actinoplanes sp. N902-109]
MTAGPVFAVKSLSCLDPRWEAGSLPAVAGFAHSRFGPLVVAVGTACLDRAPGGAAGGAATALVLASGHGDTETLDGASRRLATGRPVGPLLFFQSAPTAALGHLSRVHGFLGPMICVSAPGTELLPRAFAVADILLGLAGIRDVLLVGAESAANPRVARLERAEPSAHTRAPALEAAFALLLSRPVDDGGMLLRAAVHPPSDDAGDLGWLDGALQLCRQGERMVRLGAGAAASSAGTLTWVAS